MTYPDAKADGEEIIPTPIDVRIVKADDEVSIQAATFGSWLTVSWPVTTAFNAVQFPLQLLALDRSRRKAQLVVQTTGYIVVGSRGQVANNQGGQLPAGRYPIENIEALYTCSDGVTAATVTVLQERD